MMVPYSFPRSLVQILVALVMIVAGGWAASRVSAISGTDSMAGSVNVATVGVPPAGYVRLVIPAVQHDYGKIVIFEFDDAVAWSDQNFDAASGYLAVPAKAGQMAVDIPVDGIKKRAWSLFHDENDDGDLNMDGGYPLEAFGSSGAHTALDEPSFSEAASDAAVVVTKLFYPY